MTTGFNFTELVKTLTRLPRESRYYDDKVIIVAYINSDTVEPLKMDIPRDRPKCPS